MAAGESTKDVAARVMNHFDQKKAPKPAAPSPSAASGVDEEGYIMVGRRRNKKKRKGNKQEPANSAAKGARGIHFASSSPNADAKEIERLKRQLAQAKRKAKDGSNGRGNARSRSRSPRRHRSRSRSRSRSRVRASSPSPTQAKSWAKIVQGSDAGAGESPALVCFPNAQRNWSEEKTVQVLKKFAHGKIEAAPYGAKRLFIFAGNSQRKKDLRCGSSCRT